MATPATTTSSPAPRAFQPYVPAYAIAGRIHAESRRHRRAVRPAVRRVHGVPRPARGSDRQRVDPDRRARDLGAEEARRIDHPREQHRPDHRIGRRIGRRRRGVHHSRADLPDAERARLLQLLPDLDAGVCRRHPRRPDDGAAAPRAHRQGTRRAALPGRDRVRRRAGGRRARRQARVDGVRRARHRRAVEVAVVDLQPLPDRARLLDAANGAVPERDAERGHLARVHGRRLRHRSAHRRDRCSPAACCRGWCCCRC